MKRGRIFLGVVVASGLAVAVACSFPDVTYLEGSSDLADDAASDTGPLADAGDGDGGDDAGDVVIVELDASLTTPIDASGCEASDHPCDCDEDGWERIDPDAGCNGDGGKPVLDCDDTVAGINPGVDQGGDINYIRNKWPDGAKYTKVGDWNCDGTVDQEKGNLNCALLCTTNVKGFTGSPECGNIGDRIECKYLLGPLICSTVDAGAQVARGCM